MNCQNCNAELPITGFFCEYCGSPIPERVKIFDTDKTWEENSIILNNNLEALNCIPRPSVSEAIVSVLWWYFAILTLGIITIWWKKPNTNFNLDYYEAITSVIRLNIQSLKNIANNNNFLIKQYQPLEIEFNKLTKEFQNKLKIRRITIFVTLVVLIGFTIYAQIEYKNSKTISGLNENSPAIIEIELIPKVKSGVFSKYTDVTYRITNKSNQNISTLRLFIQALNVNGETIGEQKTYDYNINPGSSKSYEFTLYNVEPANIKKWKVRINELRVYADSSNDYSNSFKIEIIN